MTSQAGSAGAGSSARSGCAPGKCCASNTSTRRPSSHKNKRRSRAGCGWLASVAASCGRAQRPSVRRSSTRRSSCSRWLRWGWPGGSASTAASPIGPRQRLAWPSPHSCKPGAPKAAATSSSGPLTKGGAATAGFAADLAEGAAGGGAAGVRGSVTTLTAAARRSGPWRPGPARGRRPGYRPVPRCRPGVP